MRQLLKHAVAALAALGAVSTLPTALAYQQPGPGLQRKLEGDAAQQPVAVPQSKPKPDTGVSINHPNDTTAQVPITAHIFTGSPGPKRCRGSVMLALDLPKPGMAHTNETCYDFPSPAECGVFMGNQEDGCEARLFTESGCGMFVNLAVFMPEMRAIGGYFRSMAVRCGIPPRAVPALSFGGVGKPKQHPA